jgi:hypothetical protein
MKSNLVIPTLFVNFGYPQTLDSIGVNKATSANPANFWFPRWKGNIT